MGVGLLMRTSYFAACAVILVLLFADVTSTLASDQDDPFQYAGRSEMNGYQLNDFKDFEKKWRLVTVRYRKDTGELRWTFANDLAWKVLSKGSVDYPKGAAFAKVGIVTVEDSQFPSSAVPSGARRYQFMVRDEKKHAETGGWGYALFDVEGKTFPENPKQAAMACYACHQVVKNRGQVFSQPFQFAPYLKDAFISSAAGFHTLTFDWQDSKGLPSQLKQHLPKETKRIRVLTDKTIRDHLFQGTLDEIRPSLQREAYEHQSPAALISSDNSRFSLMIPVQRPGCKTGRAFRAINTLPRAKDGSTAIAEKEICNP